MSSLFIVIPAYNESENIEQTQSGTGIPIVESPTTKKDKSRLVIINDGSKDNTYAANLQSLGDRPALCLIPLDQAKRRPRFHCSLRLPLCH